MLIITLCLLPIGVLSIGLLKYSSSPQKSLPHIPRAENYDDMREHSDHDFLQDYKTSCIPTTSQYLISTRKRRDLLKTFFQQHYRTHKGNLSDLVIWDTNRKQDNSIQFLAVGTSSNGIQKKTKKNTGSMRMNSSLLDNQLQENKNLEGTSHNKQNLDILEDFELDYYGSGADRKELPQGEDLYSILYDEGNGGKNEDFPWDKSEHQEEDKIEKDPISEHIMADDAYIQQHAFWKGEGDKKTIRETQGKLMKQYMDLTVDPCEDFYQYACGNWGKLNPIPKDKAAFDTFEMLRESLDTILKELLEKKILANENEAYVKAKQLFKSCMNNDILERRKEKPLIDLLNNLGGWPIICPDWDESNFDWLVLMARLRLYNNDILISEWVGPDIKNSDEYVIQFDQTSLGLPTRDYYLHASNSIYLDAYRMYLIKIATLLGASSETASVQAQEIVAFETALAKITSAPDERRNVSELYQRMTVEELHSQVPQVDWIQYLTIVLGHPCNESEPVVIFALRYVQDLVALLGRSEPRTISNYLLWRFVRHRVNNLDDRFQDAKQKFYYILFGREKSPPRWKNCVAQVNSNLGMAMGAMFVQKYFDENSKNDTWVMTKEIQGAFKEILKMTNWIDNDTKSLAAEKVDSMMLRIGYPDFILDGEQLKNRYRDVDIHPDKYFENTLNILQHLTRVEQANLGCAVNKTMWNTAPAVVNAYYSRNKNQIMVPAGILQPPFYHRYFPRSLNYGGIGVVIGHEITHGFDDKGRLFDKDGNLHRWWKDEAINNFHERAQCLIDQYSKYIVQEVGIQIDGANTQGENIADNGGIKEAFRAYKNWLSTHNAADETLPGLNFTGLQLFYLNFAQVWCGNTRPEATRNKLKTSVHSPGKFRVIGTLTNSKDFSEVFSCPPGSPMNPKSKCTVW